MATEFKTRIPTDRLSCFMEGLELAKEKQLEFPYIDMVMFQVMHDDKDLVDSVWDALRVLNLIDIKELTKGSRK